MMIYKYFLWLIIYSFVGWAYETTLCSIREKRFINRGFLYGPICPVYGFGAITMIIILYGRTENVVELFIFSMILTTSVEYITGWLLETLFNKKWWDYSNHKLNIHGRVCMLGGVVFGAMGVLLIKFVHPYVLAYTNLVPGEWINCLAGIALAIMAIDIYVTVTNLINEKNSNDIFDREFNKIRETFVEYANRLKEKLL